MIKKAKIIKLLLEDGTLNDVVKIVEDEWIGSFYSIPRDKVENFIRKKCDKPLWGIYLLLSNERVYVGQSQNLKERIRQHLIQKNWWETVIILTTKDNNFNKADIDYLENKLIEKAKNLKTLDIDNLKSGNPAKVDEFKEVTLNQYLEESLFILEFIGVRIFTEKNKNTITGLVPNSNKNTLQSREKNDVFNYLNILRKSVDPKATYARLQENKDAYWMNPSVNCLKKDWQLILNNQNKNQIYILSIPAYTFECSYPKEKGKLVTRKDLKNKLELLIDAENLIDRRTKVSFRNYLVEIIDY